MNEQNDEKLVLKFEPSTIEHLGVKMYSHIPPALAELVANSYDACAKVVNVKLYNGEDKRIVVEDNGSGMSFDEINDHFLRIGRNRRKEHQASPCGRTATGKKGLGKLALFGLGTQVEIITAKNGEKVTFILNYDDILEQHGEYIPYTVRENIDDNELSGTTITLRKLKHKSDFSANDYAVSLARLFNFKEDRNTSFKLYISLNDEEPISINNKLKYENIQSEFEWDEEDILKLVHGSSYEEKKLIKGKIITSEKPLKPGLRGITLFANGRMVNTPEFFGQSESSHFFSYTTGWLDVNFVDDWEEDVISTNRQSIDWEIDKTIALKKFLGEVLSSVERDWRQKRKEKRDKELKENTDIDIDDWLNKLPNPIKQSIELVLKNVERSELTNSQQAATIKTIHKLVPEYPEYHWRHLNGNIQSVSKSDYERGDYLRAAEEAIKLYEKMVADKGKLNEFGVSLMSKSFGDQLEPLKITNNITSTEKNIERGQKQMSMGVMAGFRNPAMHNPKDFVHPGIFDDIDCLDLLSLISYLFKKLEKARNINDN